MVKLNSLHILGKHKLISVSIKTICVFLIFCTCASFVSCISLGNRSLKEKITIVCTAFPQYDFVKNIISGEETNFDLVYLFDNGADVHSFQTDVDFKVKIKIIESDMFIYNGGESDSWAQSILYDKSMNKECKTLSLMEMIDDESLIRQGEHIHHSSYDEKNESEESHEHKENFDEHVWLSLKNAVSICEKITDVIISLDNSNEEIYKKNLEEYRNKLYDLDEKSETEFDNVDSPYVLIADRFPFAYLFKDYSIEYDSAFSGCTSETEATYDNIIRLCKSVEERNIYSIFVLEKSNSKVSSSIISASRKDINVLTLNSMQSVNKKEIEEGFNYYDSMKINIETILNSMKNQ